MSRAVTFIGRPKHLEIRLADESDFYIILDEIKEKWKEGGRFFEGSNSVRVVGSLVDQQRKQLVELLVDGFGIPKVEFIGGINSDSQGLINPLKGRSRLSDIDMHGNAYGMLAENEFADDFELKSAVSNVREAKTLFVSETIRNGQRVEYNGDIVVIGDSNAGSELVATGSIVVMGALRGKAHAGSAGDESTSVSAMKLCPQQLRIGRLLAIPSKDDKERNFSEIARVDQGTIKIYPIGTHNRKRFKR